MADSSSFLSTPASSLAQPSVYSCGFPDVPVRVGTLPSGAIASQST